MDILKQKVDVLRKATEKVIPKKVSEKVVKSVETGIDYLKSIWEKRKVLKEEARKKVRKKIFDFNKKITKLFEKPEFEITERVGFAGKKIIIWGKEGYFPVDFFRENEKNIDDIFQKNTETKINMVLHCIMKSTDIRSGEEITDVGYFASSYEENFKGNNNEELINKMIWRIFENMDNFTVEMRDIDIFERNNGISVHVFGWNNERVYIHRKAKVKINHHVYLLMLTDQGKKLFCLVRSLSRLLRKENQRNQRFYCDNCLNCRFSEKALEEHKKFCKKQKPCETFPAGKKNL